MESLLAVVSLVGLLKVAIVVVVLAALAWGAVTLFELGPKARNFVYAIAFLLAMIYVVWAFGLDDATPGRVVSERGGAMVVGA